MMKSIKIHPWICCLIESPQNGPHLMSSEKIRYPRDAAKPRSSAARSGPKKVPALWKKTTGWVGSWTQFLCHHYGQQDNMWVIDYQRFSVGNHLYKASCPLSYIMKSKIQLYSSNPPKKKACFRLPASCFLSPPSRIHILRSVPKHRPYLPSACEGSVPNGPRGILPAPKHGAVRIPAPPGRPWRRTSHRPTEPPPPPLDDAGWEIPAKRVQPKRHGKGRQFRETGHFLVENYNNFILRGGITK